MADNTNGNERSPVQAIRDYLHAAFSLIFRAICNILARLQQPAPSFPHKPFSLAIALILGYLQVSSQGKGSTAKPLFDSDPALYYTAVASFLIYCLAAGFETVSSSHPLRPIPEAASHLLHRLMFLASSLSFAATASFLFPDSVRAVMFASIFTIISTVYLLCCFYPFQDIHIQGNAIV